MKYLYKVEDILNPLKFLTHSQTKYIINSKNIRNFIRKQKIMIYKKMYIYNFRYKLQQTTNQPDFITVEKIG